MAVIEIADLGTVGLIRDQEGNILPPEAWTYARNMRAVADGIERIGGQTQALGTPPIAPHFAMSISTPSQVYWLYTSLTKGYVYDGATHTDITRVLGDYNTGNTRDWNGALLGGVPILNNGIDPPQQWAPLSPGTKLVALANWPANTKCRVMRAFGPSLIALNVTEGSTVFPHLVRWSHPADPGTVPISWDASDPTRDAGRVDLPDVNAGVIVDGLSLRGNFFVYKEGSVWRMTFVGGTFLYDFKTFLETAGALTSRCVTITADGSKHVFASQDDILIHDGNSYESVIANRYKTFLFNAMDTVNYINSFIFINPYRDEIVFCFPEKGHTYPNRAMIWNYRLGKNGSITEADVNYRNAAIGVVESSSGLAWNDPPDSQWNLDLEQWSTQERRKVVLCGTDASKFYSLDTGITNDGVDFEGKVVRESLALVGRKRTGEWIVDWQKRKMVRRLWVRATGGPIAVRVGFQEQENGVTTWTPAQTFNVTTQQYLDVFGSGRAVGIEFSSYGYFKILSYKLEGELIGDTV